MKAIIKYYLRYLIKSYIYIVPFFFLIVFLIVSYAFGLDSILSGYAESSIAIYIIAVWITFTFNEIEDTTQKQLVMLSVNKEVKYYSGRIIFLFLFVSAFSIISIIYPIIFGSFSKSITVTDVLKGILIQGIVSLLGIGFANFFESSKFKDRKIAIILVFIILLLSCLQGVIIRDYPAIKYIILVLPPAYYLIDCLDKNVMVPAICGFAYSLVLITSYLRLSMSKKFL
ncbi:hypothetical protein [Clostridium manihotivorum]|uniref:ABC-2 family transporter protein n=1 Tax=Clostridium manihotivorum TaxID=2320868 RepID=A0A3R5UFE9_9CLOT|nr:hypothetical protein [Clostridium manihotivorum]QAA32300.1 hypothetical protein C1I91_12000 [Clostridium manihotivorum]